MRATGTSAASTLGLASAPRRPRACGGACVQAPRDVARSAEAPLSVHGDRDDLQNTGSSIVTPYNTSAACMVRLLCVITDELRMIAHLTHQLVGSDRCYAWVEGRRMQTRSGTGRLARLKNEDEAKTIEADLLTVGVGGFSPPARGAGSTVSKSAFSGPAAARLNTFRRRFQSIVLVRRAEVMRPRAQGRRGAARTRLGKCCVHEPQMSPAEARE